jgi:hypothetical protein
VEGFARIVQPKLEEHDENPVVGALQKGMRIEYVSKTTKPKTASWNRFNVVTGSP